MKFASTLTGLLQRDGGAADPARAAADRLVACGNGPVGLTAGEVIDPARALFNSWVSGKVAL